MFSTSLISGCLGLIGEIYSNTYDNYEEAVTSGSIERGWIPDFLPVSATNIFEKHDLDTNNIIVKFDFDINKPINLPENCQTVDRFSNPKFLKAKWCSDDLVKSANTHFKCGQDIYVAISENTVYY